MADPLTLRPVTDEEACALYALSRSRTAEARVRDRARIGWLAHEGQRVAAIKAEVGAADGTVRRWIGRFNERGLAGLQDERRGGRPPIYTAAQVGEVVAASLTDPQELGLPEFDPVSWTGQV